MKGKTEILEKGKWGGIRINLSKEVVYQNYVKFEHMKMIGKGITGEKKTVQSYLELLTQIIFASKFSENSIYKTKIFHWQQFSCMFWGRTFAENISVLI